jgi:hypothetical protein
MNYKYRGRERERETERERASASEKEMMRVGRKLPMSFIDKLGVYIESPSRRHNMTSTSKEKDTYFSTPFCTRSRD